MSMSMDDVKRVYRIELQPDEALYHIELRLDDEAQHYLLSEYISAKNDQEAIDQLLALEKKHRENSQSKQGLILEVAKIVYQATVRK